MWEIYAFCVVTEKGFFLVSSEGDDVMGLSVFFDLIQYLFGDA